MTHAQLFRFESDFVASLRCIPMAVRLKLDRVGVKLSLRQWSRFTVQDRARLLTDPCGAPAEVIAYRARLAEIVALRAGEPARPLPEPSAALAEAAARTPVGVAVYARAVGVAPPSAAQWRALSELQRFALIKLTRDHHDNVNFLPAMREFGLVA